MFIVSGSTTSIIFMPDSWGNIFFPESYPWHCIDRSMKNATTMTLTAHWIPYVWKECWLAYSSFLQKVVNIVKTYCWNKGKWYSFISRVCEIFQPKHTLVYYFIVRHVLPICMHLHLQFFGHSGLLANPKKMIQSSFLQRQPAI